MLGRNGLSRSARRPIEMMNVRMNRITQKKNTSGTCSHALPSSSPPACLHAFSRASTSCAKLCAAPCPPTTLCAELFSAASVDMNAPCDSSCCCCCKCSTGHGDDMFDVAIDTSENHIEVLDVQFDSSG